MILTYSLKQFTNVFFQYLKKNRPIDFANIRLIIESNFINKSTYRAFDVNFDTKQNWIRKSFPRLKKNVSTVKTI